MLIIVTIIISTLLAFSVSFLLRIKQKNNFNQLDRALKQNKALSEENLELLNKIKKRFMQNVVTYQPRDYDQSSKVANIIYQDLMEPSHKIPCFIGWSSHKAPSWGNIGFIIEVPWQRNTVRELKAALELNSAWKGITSWEKIREFKTFPSSREVSDYPELSSLKIQDND
jgi:hypothetical protein